MLFLLSLVALQRRNSEPVDPAVDTLLTEDGDTLVTEAGDPIGLE